MTSTGHMPHGFPSPAVGSSFGRGTCTKVHRNYAGRKTQDALPYWIHDSHVSLLPERSRPVRTPAVSTHDEVTTDDDRDIRIDGKRSSVGHASAKLRVITRMAPLSFQ